MDNDQLLIDWLNKMIELEELGYVSEAIRLADSIRGVFSQNEDIILLEKAKMEFRNGYKKEALFDFIKAYNSSGDLEVYELILEAYYLPDRKAFEETFQKNRIELEKYPHYRNMCDNDVLRIFPVWQDDSILVCVNTDEKEFMAHGRGRQRTLKKGVAFLMADEMWMEDLEWYEGNSGKTDVFMDMDIPVYMVYDEDYWKLLIQLYDLEALLKKNRVVFLVGEESVREYFMEDGVLFPDGYILNGYEKKYRELIDSIRKELEQGAISQSTANAEHYFKNKNRIIDNIKSGKPRILFLTSRFTTILQYHARDCRMAAERLGCETTLLKERDGIHRLKKGDIIKEIYKFKPDIIFCMDHFRFEHGAIPPELVWICWVQDPMKYIMDKDTPAKLLDRDFVMNHFTTWKKFREVGYSEQALIESPVPASSSLYRPYRLSEKEIQDYGCDICMVCHASDADGHIADIIKQFPNDIRDAIYSIYKGYQKYVYETGEIFYSEDMFREYIKGALAQHYHMVFETGALNYISNDMYTWFNQRVFRQAMVDWILDAGFTNIKLWGNGWKDNARYKDYAMGPAENGETLSKIYQASKIVLGNNVMTTSAARAWETMLSGGFYMSNYIPEEEDVTDIRRIIEVGKDVIMFYDKEDLLQKIEYYLDHEEERQLMIERGREAALERMTFDITMKRTLDEVAKRLEEN